jgi:lantibiotic leader peptide-processing serine protease
MPRIHRFVVVLLAVVAVFGAFTGVRSGSTEAASAEGAQEYVVAMRDDAMGELEHRVHAAGGRVVEVLEPLGLARVQAAGDAAGFLDQMRAQPDVVGAARNHAVGTARPGLPHRFAEERPSAADRVAAASSEAQAPAGSGLASPSWAPAGARSAAAVDAEPLADRQWNMHMIGATPEAAHAQATGAGVDVGIIDTGIDASHPDLAPNVDVQRSRNFTTDRPDIDGPCEVPSCVDPADTDGAGHGTHVAGIVASAANDLGGLGVAPRARLVNLRAGQDSGYFFLYEVANALIAAGDLGLDVVNMSFYTDPWLFNCASRADYLSGDVSDEELAQQQLTRQVVTDALNYAHDRGVTLVAAVGNEHFDLAAPERHDVVSPGLPAGSARPRTISRSCLDLPNEGPHVISVSAVGPSGTKADYSSYGLGSIEVAAPGGWLRDKPGTPEHRTPANMVLSTYPEAAAIREGLAGPDGQPVDAFSVRQCNPAGTCGFYSYLQGTSMAAPHVAGVAALVIERHGEGSSADGYGLAPDRVAEILAVTATDQACPPSGTQTYSENERDASWSAVCQGTTTQNGFYGEGLVNASQATAP